MRSRLGRARRGYTRTVVVGVAATGLLLGSLGAAAGQEPGGTPFSNGTAKATAIVANVAPGVGALQLGITSGVAVAEVKNTIGQSQATTLDLGLIGSTLTGESCTGSDPVVSPNDLPTPIRVDSRQGDAQLVSDEVGQDPIRGGHKEVYATQDPSARAISRVVEVIAGLFTVTGGTAEAATRVIPGEAREARAEVKFDLDIAGLVQLGGLRWDAFHRTGSKPAATASFELGTFSAIGVPAIPTDALLQLETALNATLAYSGLSIQFPRVERFTEPADLIRVSPLRILVKDSPAGGAILGPVLNLTRAEREQLFDQAAAAYCTASGLLLVGDIGVSIVSGTGFLAVELGGAEATTGELVLESPFTDEPGLAPAVGPVGAPVASGPIGGFPSAPPIAGGSAPPTRPAASIGPLRDHCESAHPLRDTKCSKGALLAVGVAGLIATAGVGALDWRHQRKRRAAEVGA